MQYAIAGLQRTGTSYLERLILDNLGLGGLGNIFWKHALPAEVDPTTLSSTKIVLNTRHPVMWLQSCVSNNSGDILAERPEYFLGRNHYEGYAALYSDFYNRWTEQIKQSGGLCAKYEDVLGGDFSIFEPIAADLGREIREVRADVSKVPHSVEFSNDDLERQRRFECHISKYIAVAFWRMLDHSLVSGLNYNVEDLTFTEEVGLRTLAYRLVQRPEALSAAELDRLIAASTERFVDDHQVLQALGRQAARRFGNPRKALELYEAAFAASEREREFGAYPDLSLSALGALDAIRSLAPKITASSGGEVTGFSNSMYASRYERLLTETLSEFEKTVAADADANVTTAARCRNLVYLADLLQRSDRLEEAETTLRRAIALDRAYVAAQSQLGDVLQRQGRLEDAEACLRAAIQIAPDDARLRAALSDVLRRQDKIEAALTEARAAIDSVDPDVGWFHQHACLALQAGRLDEASESLRTALRFEPGHRDHLLVLAQVQQRQGRLDDAVGSLRQAILFAPKDGHLHVVLSDVLQRQGRLEEAVSSLRGAVRISPRDGHLHFVLGDLLQREGHLDAAAISLRQATEISPQDGYLHFVLGDVLRRQGDLDQAAISLRRAIQITPQIGRFHFTLSDVLRRQRRFSDAALEAAAAIDCPDAEPWWLHHHARLASRIGDLRCAESSLRRALEFEPDNPRHLLFLARLLLLTGRFRKARETATRAARHALRRRRG